MAAQARLDDDPKHRRNRKAELSAGILLGLIKDNLDTLYQSAAAREPADPATAETALGYLEDLREALGATGAVEVDVDALVLRKVRLDEEAAAALLDGTDILDEPNEEPYRHPDDCPHPHCQIPF